MKRRHLLRAAGFTLAIPFLPSMARRAMAQPPPPRFVAFWTPNGQRGNLWHPQVVDPSPVDGRLEYDLASSVEARGFLSPILDESLNPFVRKMTVMRGLDGLCENNHNPFFALSGAAYTGEGHRAQPVLPTIDELMVRAPGFYEVPPVVDALRLQPHWTSYIPKSISGARREDGSLRKLPVDWSSHAVFERLFAGADEAPGVDPAERRRSVIDRVFADFQRVRGHRRLSRDDRQRLDAYADHMQSLQARLEARPVIRCSGPDLREESDRQCSNIYRNHIDLLVAALACGMTRVGVLVMRHGTEGGAAGWHGTSHENGDDATARSLVLNRFANSAFAYLLQQMEAVAEPGGTLLDNALVYRCNELSGGRGHDHFDMPMVLAGSAGGQLRTGVGFDFRQMPERRWAGGKRLGVPYNWFLHSLMETFGLRDEDWEHDGELGFGEWTKIGHMYARGAWDRFATQRRARLPGWRRDI